jgi:predicted short-subunit dehydrogenase-like oxidoreductase (DUF2520 family)
LSKSGNVVTEIYSRTLLSAERARAAIGSGKVVADIADLKPAEILVVSTSDSFIADVAEQLSARRVAAAGTIAFHCSGATPSSVLHKLRLKGTLIASVHPVKTFTMPQQDARSFAGTWCGIEGDTGAVEVLHDLLAGAGAETFDVSSDSKALYHAAMVFMCNALFPLIEAGFQCYEAAGVPRHIARQIAGPIMRATVDNALRSGPAMAMTGPIARGDEGVVKMQLAALALFKPEYRKLYELIGCLATDLATEKGVATTEKIDLLRNLLQYKDHITPGL